MCFKHTILSVQCCVVDGKSKSLWSNSSRGSGWINCSFIHCYGLNVRDYRQIQATWNACAHYQCLKCLNSAILDISNSSPHVKQKHVRESKISQNWVQRFCKVVRILLIFACLDNGGGCRGEGMGQMSFNPGYTNICWQWLLFLATSAKTNVNKWDQRLVPCN